jgi:hypothetical protein
MAEESNRLPELSDAHLREIGRVAIMFNRLQAVLRLLIGRLLRGDEVTNDVAVRGDSFYHLLAKVDALVNARIGDGALRADLAEWGRAARRANELRRETIHSHWIPLKAGNDAEAMALLHSTTGKGIRGGLLTAEQIGLRARVIEATGFGA